LLGVCASNKHCRSAWCAYAIIITIFHQCCL
jgi:hypothetical protein